MKDLFVKMFDNDPKTRINMSGIMMHPWFNKTNGYADYAITQPRYDSYLIHKMSSMKKEMEQAKACEQQASRMSSTLTSTSQVCCICFWFGPAGRARASTCPV